VAQLKDQVQSVLDECRMLMLGGQVLMGFGAQAVLERGFFELSGAGRVLCVVSMLLLTVGVVLVMWPAAYHRIVLEGEDDPCLPRFASTVLCVVLAPFAVGLGASLYVAGERSVGVGTGVALGVGACMAALGSWYVYPLVERGPAGVQVVEQDKPTDVTEKIRHVLTEARMVLPGAQALLGFGTIVVLKDTFKELPQTLRVVHVISLCFIALATVLLMTPAAYHRIVERGEMDEEFHRVAARLLLLGMAALAPGLAGSVWVVLERATGSRAAGAVGAVAVVVLCYGLWFGWTLVERRRRLKAES
jgi:hypothetical protein